MPPQRLDKLLDLTPLCGVACLGKGEAKFFIFSRTRKPGRNFDVLCGKRPAGHLENRNSAAPTRTMCGICGSTNDYNRRHVARMNAAMVARGPDDEGTYADQLSGVALGARRLSIIDVEGGHQPVSNEDGTVWAALNGEVYNHSALRETLRGRGHRFTSSVDTEVLVHLYEEHGAAMVHALEGMYAFALWDIRRQELLVVRDRFGEKPVFYAERGGDLLFASELDVLLAGLDVEPELEPASVDAFFVFGYVPGPCSIARGVKQLPPGHLLRWEPCSRRVQVEPYWTPLTAAASSSQEPFDELVAEAGRLLECSVRSRLNADVPLGVFLSGGLDSTLIAALAAQVSDKPVKTFTVGYDTGAVNETAQARRTAHELGTEHHELILTQEQLLRRVPALLAGMDQPLADQALVSLHAIAEHAQRDVTVAIGGEGADELFGGYPRYRWLHRAEQLGGVLPPPLAKRLSLLAGSAPYARAGRVADVLRPGETLERYLDWVTGGRPALRGRLYGPALRGQIPQNGFVDDLGGRLNGASSGPVIRQLMVLDQLHWLPDDVLVKADRAGMRVSLEIRTPYLNRELAEFAGTVSERIHVRDGGKALLRALLGHLAPEVAGRRPKTAFRVPAAEWLRGPLAPLVDRQLAHGSAFAEGWFDRREAAVLFAEHQAGTRDRSGAIWPLLAFGLWLDRIRGRDLS
jgi:asparagine synthase (glutamine-hydrolysing)